MPKPSRSHEPTAVPPLQRVALETAKSVSTPLRFSREQRQQLREDGLRLMLEMKDSLRRSVEVSAEDLQLRVR